MTFFFFVRLYCKLLIFKKKVASQYFYYFLLYVYMFICMSALQNTGTEIYGGTEGDREEHATTLIVDNK